MTSMDFWKHRSQAECNGVSHSLEPCKECGIWHCPVCGCRTPEPKEAA